MTENQVKVALWCVPRSMSTVLGKCMSGIDDMEVYMELYTYATAMNGVFKTKMGRELPKKLEGNESDFEEAKLLTRGALISRRISCHDIKHDLENTPSKYVFIKEMAFSVDHVREYLPQGFKHAFLTREPTRVYTSYRKGQQKLDYIKENVRGELDIIRDDFPQIQPMTWYEKQHQLWKYVKENFDPNPVVIDAFDLCSQPEKILKSFCDAVGFPFTNSLLQWSPTTTFPKNFVTVGETLHPAFYSTALNSTQFTQPSEFGPIPRDQLTDDVIRCVYYSMPFYNEIYKNRLII